MSNPDKVYEAVRGFIAEEARHKDLEVRSAILTDLVTELVELDNLMRQGRVPVEWERERGYGGQDRH